MDEEILVSLSDIVSRHPWWAARTDLVMAMLERLGIMPPASVLEAGRLGRQPCSTGGCRVRNYRAGHIPKGAQSPGRASATADRGGSFARLARYRTSI